MTRRYTNPRLPYLALLVDADASMSTCQQNVLSANWFVSKMSRKQEEFTGTIMPLLWTLQACRLG